MSEISRDVLGMAVSLLNQDNIQSLAGMLKTKAQGARDALSTSENREEVAKKGVDALKKALDYFRYQSVKDIRNIKRGLTTFKDYAYQKTLNSAAAEQLLASVTGEPSAEMRQRRLEKILYLYIMEKGLEMTPPINISTDLDSPETRHEFFRKLLGNETTRNEVREMVRNLMVLFFYDRIGVSAVQYTSNMGDKQLTDIYVQLINKDRQATIDADIISSINSNKFVETFLDDIIEDTEEGIANDAKYFGASENMVKLVQTKLMNFIDQHNYYVTTRIKSTRTLENEIASLDKISNVVSGLGEGMPKQEGNILAIKKAINNMIIALNSMLLPKDGYYNVYQFANIDELITDRGKVTAGEPILVPSTGDVPSAASTRFTRKRSASEAGLDETEQFKRANIQTLGGRRTRRRRRGGKRKATKKHVARHSTRRKKGTIRKSRKGGMHHGKPHGRRTRSKK